MKRSCASCGNPCGRKASRCWGCNAAALNAARSRDKAERVEEFLSFREQGCSWAEIQRALGVCRRTIERYAAETSQRVAA